MKGQGKLTRIRLDDDRQERMLILGIVSAEPDYKLSLLINKKTGISLKSSSPLNIQAEGTNLSFSVFSFSDEDSETCYSLVSNRSEAGLLLKSLKNIDYIMAVRGGEEDGDALIKNIRETESVTGVFRLNAASDRNVQLLLVL